MFTNRLRAVPLLLAWAIVLRMSLSIVNWPGDWGHGICGPWGCGPKMQTLVGCHVSWLILLIPITLITSKQLAPKSRSICGILTIVVALAGILGIAVYEYSTWRVTASEGLRGYFWHRVGFSVVNLVDLPLLELLILGLVMTLWLPPYLPKDVAGGNRPLTPESHASDRVTRVS